jgi:hypothetical protein
VDLCELSDHETDGPEGIFPAHEKIRNMEQLPVIACSLSGEDLPERRRRWLALTDRALAGRTVTPAGIRLTFRADEGVEDELRVLAALERECCGFAGFDVVASGDQVTLDVTSTGDGVTAVRELFS